MLHNELLDLQVRRGHLLPAIGNGFLFTAMLFCSLNALKYASVALYTVGLTVDLNQ